MKSIINEINTAIEQYKQQMSKEYQCLSRNISKGDLEAMKRDVFEIRILCAKREAVESLLAKIGIGAAH